MRESFPSASQQTPQLYATAAYIMSLPAQRQFTAADVATTVRSAVIHATLRRLTDEGWLELAPGGPRACCPHTTAGGGGAHAKRYRATAAGRAAMKSLLAGRIPPRRDTRTCLCGTRIGPDNVEQVTVLSGRRRVCKTCLQRRTERTYHYDGSPPAVTAEQTTRILGRLYNRAGRPRRRPRTPGRIAQWAQVPADVVYAFLRDWQRRGLVEETAAAFTLTRAGMVWSARILFPHLFTDEELVGSFFDDTQAAALAGDQMPPDVVGHLRRRYIADAAADPAVMHTIRDFYGMPITEQGAA